MELATQRTGRMLALILLLAGCTANKATYEGGEYDRVQNCRQQFSPYDPELEYCLERARRPYEDIEEAFSSADPESTESSD